MKPVLTLLAVVASLIYVSQAEADEPADSADSSLSRRVAFLEAELRQLRHALETDSHAVTTVNSESYSETHFAHTPPCATCPPGDIPQPALQWPSEKSYPTVNVGGVFQLDTGLFHQSPNNLATVGDIQDGIGFRRTRLAAYGNVAANTSYHIEIDFAASQPRFVDVWLTLSDIPALGNVRIGRWRQPFGMDELTSVKELPFLERTAVFPFAPFRQTGVGFYDHSQNERVTWALSGYRYSSENFGNVTGDNGGWGLAGRVTTLPYYEQDGDYLVHLGFAYSFNDPSRDVTRFGNVPGIQIGQSLGGLLQAPFAGVPLFVDTGVIPTDNLNQFGLEAAAAIGRLYLQSEFRWTIVRLLNGTTETIPDAYAQIRYVLTGEKIPYKKAGGVFGRIVPNEDVDFHGGRGAWELAARWSYFDLNSSRFPGPGRRLNNLTFGVNWYLNKFTKLQFNLIHAFLNDPLRGDSDANVVAARAQIDF